jgi:glycosyltransferase involved in cell wall biosynthesis
MTSITDESRSTKPIRVLHVLGRLDHGGVEVWLMNLLRNLDRNAFHFDFAVHTCKPAAFDTEARQLGARILPLDAPRRRPFTYAYQLRKLFKTQGPFDVVHSHAHFFSGYILRQAARHGIPNRIAHSHNDTRLLDRQANGPRRIYRRVARNWIRRYATAGYACSNWAAAALFGDDWAADDRWKVLQYGLDFSRFSQPRNRALLLQQMGIPMHRRIVGQIGRLAEQKNHQFSVQVLRELVTAGVDAHLLIVGGGELDSRIRGKIREAGLSERATLVGDQQDVPTYLSVMDLMIFPSVNEGLGIVALEAQAAGVPVVASDRVPELVMVVPGMVERIPLEHGPKVWAEAVIRYLRLPRWNSCETAKMLADSEFGLDRCVERLCTIYRS